MKLLDRDSPILADGAIGEYLFSLGFPGTYLACEAVIRTPEILASVHREYAAAGSELLTSNTFDANTVKLDSRGMADMCQEINCRAVQLAKRNTGLPVLGSVGPLDSGRSFNLISRDPGIIADVYSKQITGLLEGEADAILLETQVDPGQARLLFDLVRSLSPDVPVAVNFTYDRDMLTPSGFSVADTIEAFLDTDIFVLGANHGTGPLQFLDINRRLGSDSPFRIMLKPNSGLGKYSDGRFIFPENPEHFSRCMLSCTQQGAAIVGGCCGTTPAFIRRLSERLKSNESMIMGTDYIREAEVEVKPSRAVDNPPGLSGQLDLREALVIELLPPRGGDLSGFAKRAGRFEEFAPVTISIPDSPMGRVRVSPCLAGLYLREELGIEPLVHFALRDRSITRVQSDLLGLAGSGIQGLFVISGDPPSLGDYPEATAVYDLSTEDALGLMGNLTEGLDRNGRSIGTGAGFFPGTAISLGEPDLAEKIARRWDLGCRFFISQPVYSIEELMQSRAVLEEYPVLPALMPFKSRHSAEYLASEVPGITVPEQVLARISTMDSKDIPAYSADLLVELIENLRGIASGVYLAGSASGVRILAKAWRK